jgi:hypothetical protein
MSDTMERTSEAAVRCDGPEMCRLDGHATDQATAPSAKASGKRVRTGRARPEREAKQRQRQADREHAAVQAKPLREQHDAARQTKLAHARQSAARLRSIAEERSQEVARANRSAGTSRDLAWRARAEQEAAQADTNAKEAEALVDALQTPTKPQQCRCSLCRRLCDMGTPQWCTRCKAARAADPTWRPKSKSASDGHGQPVLQTVDAVPAPALPPPPPELTSPPSMPLLQWKSLLPSAPRPPPRAVIDAFKMIEDAIPIDEYLLGIALEEMVKEKHGWEYSADWDKRICDFCGCDFSKPPACEDLMHDTCSKCAPKHKCARYVGDWHTRDVRSDDAREEEWRTDRDGCIRRDQEQLECLRSDMCKALESYGVSTAQWAEWEARKIVGADIACTMYTPPHGFKIPLATGELTYDHHDKVWVCSSPTCAFCRGTSIARYCERRGGGINRHALDDAVMDSVLTAEERQQKDRHYSCATGCMCHEPFYNLEAHLTQGEVAELNEIIVHRTCTCTIDRDVC